MNSPVRVFLCLALATVGLTARPSVVLAEPPADTATEALKPDVAALIKQSTAIYKKMKSYQHTALYRVEQKSAEGSQHKDDKYTLAVEHPNKFAYVCTSNRTAGTVCDGKTLINYRNNQNNHNQYTKSTAPADYKGINIVDDVLFEPLGTYIAALMI